MTTPRCAGLLLAVTALVSAQTPATDVRLAKKVHASRLLDDAGTVVDDRTLTTITASDLLASRVFSKAGPDAQAPAKE